MTYTISIARKSCQAEIFSLLSFLWISCQNTARILLNCGRRPEKSGTRKNFYHWFRTAALLASNHPFPPGFGGPE